MAEDTDKDSKSELPTEKKINDTLEKGNVPFSREFTNVFSLFAMILVGYFYVPRLVSDLVAVLKSTFANLHDWPLGSSADAVNILNLLGVQVIYSLAPVIIPLIIFGLASSLSQNSPSIILNRIAPKIERISLMKGLKRLFGMQGVREFVKSLFKFSAAGAVGTIVVFSQAEFVLSQIMVEPMQIPASIHSLFIKVSIGLAMTIAILGVVDLIWVRKEWFNDLKMSHQEVKDERKQSEGDPQVKMRTQSLARDRARRRMISQVDDATLVIANPTHFAVAMRYNPEIDSVPLVLAKGKDLIALKIREKAEEKEIPVIEDPPLARSLYKAVDVDQEIPAEFYVPIAKLIRILSDAEKGST